MRYGTLDKSLRLTIPKGLREKLGGRVTMMRGESCILVFNQERRKEQEQRIIEELVDQQRKGAKGAFYSRRFDSQGRIHLPVSLINGLISGHDVLLIEVNGHLEIWGRSEYFQEAQKSAHNMKLISSYGDEIKTTVIRRDFLGIPTEVEICVSGDFPESPLRTVIRIEDLPQLRKIGHSSPRINDAFQRILENWRVALSNQREGVKTCSART